MRFTFDNFVSKSIRKSLRMFNLYQHMKPGDAKEQKEAETTGHDRFYQERSRSSYRKKKKRACRRAQSAAEFDPASVAAANKRDAFRLRSVSTDKEESEEEISERAPLVAQKIDFIAKFLFNKSLMGSGSGKSSPSEATSSPRVAERSMESSVALAICNEYLAHTPRYSMMSPLGQIGSRPNKHWFAIHDNSIKTERLLILMPLSSRCSIEPSDRSRELMKELFRALHHPYICPVLDLEMCSGHAIAVLPYNSRGSLKDVIYKSAWSDEYCRKYNSSGAGLPPTQVARFGRQMLEGLLFLKEKGFPPFRHLHTGNVVVQNGVARICGIENTLIGAPPRQAIRSLPLEHVESLALGHVLFEMCAADTDLALITDLPAVYSQVVDIIELIFSARPPSLHELLLCELFRKIDLREMKGSCLPNFSQRLSHSCLSLLGEVSRRQSVGATCSTPCSSRGMTPGSPSPATPPSRRRYLFLDQDYTEEWQH
nr:slowpoke-binding protein isoform X3 [Danaus plexippus plexippus]